MNKIEKIKSIVSIVDLANSYGAKTYGGGNVKSTKHNPLRTEKTSSLKLYVDTNTFNDFGGVGGDVVDFICQSEGIDVFNAIQTLEKALALLIKKQERMYSEEEVLSIILKLSYDLGEPIESTKEWFSQNKKSL
jgi:DNA primase